MVRVLIVDDSKIMQVALEAALNTNPEIEVAGIAGDGLEAIDKSIQLKPDLIIMDIEMPRMNGMEATKEITQRMRIPILIVSNHVKNADQNNVFEALKAGALDVIAKPRDLLGKDCEVWRNELIDKIKMLSRIKIKPSFK